jgi:RND family efflux transporter MFP subunit
MKKVYIGGVALIGLAVAGIGAIALTRHAEVTAEASERKKEIDAGPRVRVAEAALSAAERELVLQGEARPFAQTTVYAKVSGYLRDVRVDKGDHVKEGQVLAVIESPELDRQFDAAVADSRNKNVEAKRSESLRSSGVVSQQELETDRANADVSNAQVEGLRTQKSYETLRAPFDGTVTARYADPGALLQNATGAQSGALAVVTIAALDKLRIYVYLAQRDAALVHLGDKAKIAAPEHVGEVEAAITRVAGDLDPKTRMMLAEIDVDNRQLGLIAGGFVNVKLKLAQPQVLEIPSEALSFQGKQALAAVVGADNHVSFRKVTVADDDGVHARVTEGLKPGEHVALNLGGTVADGGQVQIAK